MRKAAFLLTLYLTSSPAAFSQNRNTDSLKRVLATTKEDTARVGLLYTIGRSYLYSKPDTCLLIGEQGFALSQRINYKPGQFFCLSLVSNVFANFGNYPKALQLNLQCLKIAEETGDDMIIARSFSLLSDIYFYEGDMTRSIDYSHRAIAIFSKHADDVRLRNTITNLGDTYEKINQLDSALHYTRLGFEMAARVKDTGLLGTAFNNLGNVFLKAGKLDSAMLDYRVGNFYFRQTNNDEGFSEGCLGIAKIFLKWNNIDSSLYYARLAFAAAQAAGFTDKVRDASLFLAKYYKGVRNVDSAYAYQSAMIAANDSLFSQEKASQIQSMTYDENMRQQQIEDAREQARVKLRQNALIGGLATVLVVAFLLWINNRQKKSANKLLQKQKEEIDHKAYELALQKENLQQAYNNVELLGEIGRKITSSLSVEKIISTAYNNVNSLMDAAVFGIGIYNESLKRIEFPATYEDGKALPFYSNSLNDLNRFAVLCFKDSKEIIMGNLSADYSKYVQNVLTPHEGEQPVSLIFLPLVTKGNKLGVITVQSFRENAYSDYHLFMLRNIAIYTAIALENAESFEKLNQTVVSLKSTQAQLVQSEKMASLGELTAGIAHEIQNPLNFVNNFCELNNELIDELKSERTDRNGVTATSAGNEEETKLLNDIFQNNEKIIFHGKRADAIVKSMLQHSRTSSGQKEDTDINTLCDEYLRLAYHGLRAKNKSFNAQIKSDFDNSIGKINIMPQEIGRVILNLINNAFYAAVEKADEHIPGYQPTVTVTTKKVGDNVELRVADNGNGIPQRILEKIFQPFFTTKPSGSGTGLGLSLSYDIVKAHHGTLKVETNEGQGTVFITSLPYHNSV